MGRQLQSRLERLQQHMHEWKDQYARRRPTQMLWMDLAQPRSTIYHWVWNLQSQWSYLEIPQAVPLEHSFQTAELKRNKTAMTTASPTQVQQIVSEKKIEQPQSQIRLWFVNYPQNSQLSRRTEGKWRHLHIYSCETLTFQQKKTHKYQSKLKNC